MLDNKVEAHKIQVQAARFSLVNMQLYMLSLEGGILSVSPLSKDSIYWQNSMKGYAEIIQVVELYLIGPVRKVIIGQP